VAGKTGTTENYGNAWFIGYVPQLATAVWVGHPEGDVPMTAVHGISVTGGSFPARIFGRYMREALADVPVQDLYRASPDDLGLRAPTKPGPGPAPEGAEAAVAATPTSSPPTSRMSVVTLAPRPTTTRPPASAAPPATSPPTTAAPATTPTPPPGASGTTTPTTLVRVVTPTTTTGQPGK
jgi:penicillin-binding protein 1A